jgi:hypothetical protein
MAKCSGDKTRPRPARQSKSAPGKKNILSSPLSWVSSFIAFISMFLAHTDLRLQLFFFVLALIEGVPKVFASRWCETDFADLGRLSAGSGSVRIHA